MHLLDSTALQCVMNESLAEYRITTMKCKGRSASLMVIYIEQQVCTLFKPVLGSGLKALQLGLFKF